VLSAIRFLFSLNYLFFLPYSVCYCSRKIMSGVRVQFSMSVVASGADSKSNAWALNTMQFLADDDSIYAFPSQFAAICHHDKLFALPAAITACKNMPKWHSQCSFRIALLEAEAKIYCDSDGNPVFHGDPLDVFNGSLGNVLSTGKSATSSCMLSDIVKEAVMAAATAASSDIPSPQSISLIVEDAVITKFDPKKCNATSWIMILERGVFV